MGLTFGTRRSLSAGLLLALALSPPLAANVTESFASFNQTALVVTSLAAEIGSVALRSDGAVFDWGDGYRGHLGNGTVSGNSPTPVRVMGVQGAVAVATSFDDSYALESNGTVWGWGDNQTGELGVGTTPVGSVPVIPPFTAVPVPALITDVAGIAARDGHVLALKTDGSVWGWGNNSAGVLGNQTDPLGRPAPVGIAGVVAVSTGSDFSMALKADGTIWTWGDNTYGEMGTGTTSYLQQSTPTQASISGVTAIAAGYRFALALKRDGTVWAWGSNSEKELGNGSSSQFSATPVQVLTAAHTTLSGAAGIAAGSYTGYARMVDGTVSAWGANYAGEIGTGTSATSSPTAVKATNLSGVSALAGGEMYALALTSDGRLWGWGDDRFDELGDVSSGPVGVPAEIAWSPGPPSGVAASPQDGAATVSWMPPQSNGAGSITSYTVTSSGGQQATVPAPATTAVVTGLTPGTGYSFTVTATNSLGTGPPSAPSNSVVIPGPPSAPVNVTAVAGDAEATLTWSAAVANGNPIVQYLVTPSINGTQGTPIPTGSAATTFTVSGLANGLPYTFTVTAQNASGLGPASQPSNSVTPDVLPGEPGAPVASAGNGQATLYWPPPTPNGGSPVQQYVVTAYPANGTSPVTTGTASAVPMYTFSGLHNGVSYTFTVAAQNGAGTGPVSQPSNAVTPSGAIASGAAGSINGFQYGELQTQVPGQAGCGTNADLEPQVTVSASGTVLIAAERGLGGGSDVWRAPNGTGGAAAAACSPAYAGQPNAAVSGTSTAGGDVAMAVGSAPTSSGSYPLYVASLSRGSVSVAHSTDDGQSFVNVPVQAGLPQDDRPWIAADGASMSLLSYHDVSGNIDVLRSDDGGVSYVQVAQPISATDYRATNNEIGSLVIDHRTSAGVTSAPGGLPGFWAYQAFVAPSSSGFTVKNELFVAASSDGGFTWALRPVGCSVSPGGLDHAFPSLSVDPSGNLWAAWSDDTNVVTAMSSDHGTTWTCSGAVSSTSIQAIEPTLVATSAGVDLAYYGTPSLSNVWSVYFVQNLTSTVTGWGTPLQLNTVHSGLVCEQGVACNGDRQLYENFGIDVDTAGWAHIAYSHDGPTSTCSTDLGCPGTYTGYLLQNAGSAVGYHN